MIYIDGQEVPAVPVDYLNDPESLTLTRAARRHKSSVPKNKPSRLQLEMMNECARLMHNICYQGKKNAKLKLLAKHCRVTINILHKIHVQCKRISRRDSQWLTTQYNKGLKTKLDSASRKKHKHAWLLEICSNYPFKPKLPKTTPQYFDLPSFQKLKRKERMLLQQNLFVLTCASLCGRFE